MLENKTVVLGVTGSIAAYKAANLASMLKKEGADVHVIMTKNAINFINPITFETLTGNKCLTDTFDRNFEFSVEHVSLAKRADIIAIAPASADIIAKCSHGKTVLLKMFKILLSYTIFIHSGIHGRDYEFWTC